MRSALLPTLVMVVGSLAACSSSAAEPATAAPPLDAIVGASTLEPATASTPPISATVATEPPDILAESLTGPVWWLTGARVGDAILTPTTSIFRLARVQVVDDFGCEVGECRDGLTLVGNDACNDFVSDVQLTGSTLTLGTDGESTASY